MKSPNEDLVEVRVLCGSYGGTRDPLGVKGQIIKVSRADYERAKGTISELSGKLVGASLSLLSDEVKVKEKATADKTKKEAKHWETRKAFQEQAIDARAGQLLAAKREAANAQARVEALSKQEAVKAGK